MDEAPHNTKLSRATRLPVSLPLLHAIRPTFPLTLAPTSNTVLVHWLAVRGPVPAVSPRRAWSKSEL